MNTNHHLPDTERLGQTIAERGLAAVSDPELREIAEAARQLGASAVITGVLADPSQPAVARIRAFGRATAVFAVHRAGTAGPDDFTVAA